MRVRRSAVAVGGAALAVALVAVPVWVGGSDGDAAPPPTTSSGSTAMTPPPVPETAWELVPAATTHEDSVTVAQTYVDGMPGGQVWQVTGPAGRCC